MKTALYGVAAALAAFLAPAAHAAEIKIIASNAVREPYRELIPVFEKATGHRVTVDWGGTLDIVKRVAGGEVADIVIIPAARIDTFVKEGKLTGRVDLAKSGVGVAVRAGLPRPDISTAEALKKTLLAAKSIVLSSGPSSFYLPTLFEKMGIAADLKPKITQIGPGLGVGATLARGEGEIGFTQMSELMSVDGHRLSRAAAARGPARHRVLSGRPHRGAGGRARARLAEVPHRPRSGAGAAPPRHGAGVSRRSPGRTTVPAATVDR